MHHKGMSIVLAAALAVGAPAVSASASPALAPASTAGSSATMDQAQKEQLLQRLRELTPTRSAEADALVQRLGADTEARDALLQRVIDGSQYECAPTEMDAWLGDQLADWDTADALILQLTGVLDWPTYEALVFQPDGPQYYGVDGSHTKDVTKTFQRLQGFWDTEGDDIQLAAMHGGIVMDDARIVPFLQFFYDMTEAEAQEYADLVQSFLGDPKFQGGNHPIFTLNAFAYSDEPSPEDEQLGISDKIVMGDGIIAAMEGLGLGDVAPRGILAHEYGHHVQYELGLFDEHGGTPEATRETELEADALAGYYLSHPRGERLRHQRVADFVESFGQVGDCSFDSNGHHGTPNQRRASAAWADQLANAKGKKGHVHPAAWVSDAFRAALPTILRPDA